MFGRFPDEGSEGRMIDRPLIVGLAVGLAWLLLSGLGLWLTPPGGPWLGRIVAVVFPLLLIAFAVRIAQRVERLRNEAALLRQELESLRRAPKRADRPAASKPVTVVSPPPPISQAPQTAPVQVVTMPTPQPAPERQSSLPLDHAPTGVPPLPIDDFIRALHFPEGPDDTEGFRAMRRALKDRNAAQVVQASQDVLTLLSQSGIYMDDLSSDNARPELWRRFAQGERGGSIGGVGAIRDRVALELCSSRLREDDVFRDTVHHFLRRFDRALTEAEPEMSDAQLAALAETRTARAFMLLGRMTGVFA
jgi:hypothetical protein